MRYSFNHQATDFQSLADSFSRFLMTTEQNKPESVGIKNAALWREFALFLACKIDPFPFLISLKQLTQVDSFKKEITPNLIFSNDLNEAIRVSLTNKNNTDHFFKMLVQMRARDLQKSPITTSEKVEYIIKPLLALYDHLLAPWKDAPNHIKKRYMNLLKRIEDQDKALSIKEVADLLEQAKLLFDKAHKNKN